MQKYIYEGKTLEEAKEKALSELKVAEENLIVNILEEKNTLLNLAECFLFYTIFENSFFPSSVKIAGEEILYNFYFLM